MCALVRKLFLCINRVSYLQNRHRWNQEEDEEEEDR